MAVLRIRETVVFWFRWCNNIEREFKVKTSFDTFVLKISLALIRTYSLLMLNCFPKSVLLAANFGSCSLLRGSITCRMFWHSTDSIEVRVRHFSSPSFSFISDPLISQERMRSSATAGWSWETPKFLLGVPGVIFGHYLGSKSKFRNVKKRRRAPAIFSLETYFSIVQVDLVGLLSPWWNCSTMLFKAWLLWPIVFLLAVAMWHASSSSVILASIL
jgi:hypothetical protein